MLDDVDHHLGEFRGISADIGVAPLLGAERLHMAFVAASVAIMAPRLRLARRAPYPIWVAPFSRLGFDRFRRMVSLRAGASPANMTRAVFAVVLAIALLYNLLRAGQQISGPRPELHRQRLGWTEPPLGLLAHYLDGLVLFCFQWVVRHRIEVPYPTGR